MISAAPLYSGVHNWTSADRVRMCGINEDRRTPLSDEDTKPSSTHPLGSEERCVSGVLSKVDIPPATSLGDALMLQEDGGGSQAGAGQRLEEKPPDPAPAPVRTTPAPSRASVKARLPVLDTPLQASSSKPGKRGEPARTPEKVAGPDPPAAPLPANTDQKAVPGPGLQMAAGADSSHTVVSTSFGTLTPFTMGRICFSQVPGGVQKLPLSFPTSAVLATSQPLVYIPPANCGQSLSVTTFPTTLGVTPTLTLPMLPACLPERCILPAPTELQARPFSSSALGRPLTSDLKVASPAGSAPSVTLANSNSLVLPPPSGSSPSVTLANSNSLVLPPPAITTSATLSSMVNVSPIALTTYPRTPSSLETDSSSSPLKSPPQLEREMVSPPDAYEMPLDLSSKSHRHKHAPPNQRKTPPMPVLTPVHTSGKAALSTVLSRSDSVNQTLRGAAPPPLVMFPEFLRNGDPGPSQGSWIKNPAALIGAIPGTYVGVASPVPASVLLNKDSNLGLGGDSRHAAKQEAISIVDQGEPKNSDKRHLLVNSKDWSSPGRGPAAHPKCPLNGKPSDSQVLPVSWSQYRQPSLLSIGHTLRPNQAPPHRLPAPEYALFPNLLPGELKNPAPPQAPPQVAPEQEAPRTCDNALPKPHKPQSHKALLAPKPPTGNSVLSSPAVAAVTQPDCTAGGKEDTPLLNKTSEKAGCREDKATRPKVPCGRKSDAKPKNKVLATYMTNDRLSGGKKEGAPHEHRKKSHKKVPVSAPIVPAPTPVAVQEVDLSKVKIERIDDDESFGRLPSLNDSSWLPLEMPPPPISKIKAKVKKEPGLRGRGKHTAHQQEEEAVGPAKMATQKSKSKAKQKEDKKEKAAEESKRKWKRRRSSASPDAKETKPIRSRKESTLGRPKRRKRRSINSEPPDTELDLATPERKAKYRFRDFIPVVLKCRTRSQTGNFSFSDIAASPAEPFQSEEEEEHGEEEAGIPRKRRRVRRSYKTCRTRRFPFIKEEPEPELISPPPPEPWELRGFSTALSDPEDGPLEDGTLRRRKRRRQKNRKYQNGEYLTEKEEVSQCFRRRRSRGGYCKRKLSPDLPGDTLTNRDGLRSGPFKGPDSPSCRSLEKPSGKRKCKTKHLGGGGGGEEVKVRGRRSLQSPKSSPLKSPWKCGDPGTPHRRRGSSLGPYENIPPEARKLIVNKNAGETLLQRAARLGYKDVVLYCLQRVPGDVNHRDNAGYTALHEACSRGWTDILQVLLDHGANVNCSAQDGTRPIHDAVVNDNIETVWLLLSYGADPTLATYSGQTPIKLASSEAMRTFLSDYLSDLRGRTDGDPRASWDFYSSSVLDAKDEVCYAVLLDPSETSEKEEGDQEQEDDLLFEFSDAPLVPCYNLQVSLTSGPGNWFLVSDVVKRLKLSSRIFQARYPHFEVAVMLKKEFTRQAFASQILTSSEGQELWPQDSGETVELIRYEPELMRLLGSSVEFQGPNS
ncbi:BCL-6 corepressor-like protein 1 [Gastrophryne carolinensis]